MGLTGTGNLLSCYRRRTVELSAFRACLAFAMALATGKATLSQCPYVSDEAQPVIILPVTSLPVPTAL